MRDAVQPLPVVVPGNQPAREWSAHARPPALAGHKERGPSPIIRSAGTPRIKRLILSCFPDNPLLAALVAVYRLWST